MDFVLRQLYAKYMDQGWAIVMSAPTLLNFTMPDFTVQYFVLTYSSQESIRLEGSVPHSGILFYSISVYNSSGIPVAHKIDNELPKHYTYELPKAPVNQYYSAVLRLYVSSVTRKPLLVSILPKVFVNDKRVKQISKSQIIANTKEVSRLLSFALFFRFADIPDTANTREKQFFLPAAAKLGGLFGNPDATYLICLPRQTRTMVITGKNVKPCGRNHPLRYFGFMTCNERTTATEDSISFEALPKHKYRIWVSFSKKEAQKNGYDGEEPIILFKEDNNYPLLVYRYVRVGSDKLRAKKTKNPISAKECKLLLGNEYPDIQSF